MALAAASRTLVHPHFEIPGFIVQQSQARGTMNILPGGKPKVMLSEGDLYVYAKTIGGRHRVKSGTNPSQLLPGCDIFTGYISTPTYLMQAQTNFNHHDSAAAGNWGFSLDDAYRHGIRQGFNQALVEALLYGVNPSNYEGILNMANIVVATPPADTGSNTTVRTYDAGQLALYYVGQIANLLSTMYQFGLSQTLHIVGSQQLISAIGLSKVVQLTSYQREGAGSATALMMLENLLAEYDIDIQISFDDSLSNYSQNGYETLLMVLSEIKTPTESEFNTNQFAKLTPNIPDNIGMLMDMAAPREIRAPLANGELNTIYELRHTSGWVFRPEAVRVINQQY